MLHWSDSGGVIALDRLLLVGIGGAGPLLLFPDLNTEEEFVTDETLLSFEVASANCESSKSSRVGRGTKPSHKVNN